MAAQSMYPVICHGEYAHYPLHNRREVFAKCWCNQEMKVVPHDAEIFDAEGVPSFGAFEDGEKEFLALCRIEEQLLPVDSRRDMIGCAFLEMSWLSHARHTP